MKLTSKQRAYLKSLASNLDVIVHIGKASLTTEVLDSIVEALDKRELIKVGVLKNCIDEPKEIAIAISDNIDATVVQVIGKKIVLYKPKKKDPVILLPRD